jgi:hypothetical protein
MYYVYLTWILDGVNSQLHLPIALIPTKGEAIPFRGEAVCFGWAVLPYLVIIGHSESISAVGQLKVPCVWLWALKPLYRYITTNLNETQQQYLQFG